MWYPFHNRASLSCNAAWGLTITGIRCWFWVPRCLQINAIWNHRWWISWIPCDCTLRNIALELLDYFLVQLFIKWWTLAHICLWTTEFFVDAPFIPIMALTCFNFPSLVALVPVVLGLFFFGGGDMRRHLIENERIFVKKTPFMSCLCFVFSCVLKTICISLYRYLFYATSQLHWNCGLYFWMENYSNQCTVFPIILIANKLINQSDSWCVWLMQKSIKYIAVSAQMEVTAVTLSKFNEWKVHTGNCPITPVHCYVRAFHVIVYLSALQGWQKPCTVTW